MKLDVFQLNSFRASAWETKNNNKEWTMMYSVNTNMFCATFYKLIRYVTANSQKNILANFG